MPAISIPSSRTVSVVGDRYTFVVSGEETGGAFALMDFHVPVNHGPPPHVHSREDETFYVLAGEFEFTVAGQTQRLVTGQSLVALRDIPHTFRNVGTSMGRMIAVVTPAGLEKFFAEIGVPLPSWLVLVLVMRPTTGLSAALAAVTPRAIPSAAKNTTG